MVTLRHHCTSTPPCWSLRMIKHSIANLIMDVIIHPCCNVSCLMLVKEAPGDTALDTFLMPDLWWNWVNVWKHNLCFFTNDDVIKWKHFPRYWPFLREIYRSPVNSPRKGQWRRALIFSFLCAWINGWVNNREAGDLRRQHPHADAIVKSQNWPPFSRRVCGINKR